MAASSSALPEDTGEERPNDDITWVNDETYELSTNSGPRKGNHDSSILSTSATSNKLFRNNGRSISRDISESKFILPSDGNDRKRALDRRKKIERASLPCYERDSTTTRKGRGPASCLFRGHDHCQRLTEELDALRNIQGNYSLNGTS